MFYGWRGGNKRLRSSPFTFLRKAGWKNVFSLHYLTVSSVSFHKTVVLVLAFFSLVSSIELEEPADIVEGMVDVSSVSMLRTADVASTAIAKKKKPQEQESDPALHPVLHTPKTKSTSSSFTAESENTAKTVYTTETETDSPILPKKVCNKTFEADEEDEDEEENKSTEVVDAHFYPHWEIVSRWNDLTQKRLDLCRQRVDLEQRLFEFAELKQHRDRSEKAWHPFRDPREEEEHDPSAFFQGGEEESSLRQPEQKSTSTEKSVPPAFPTLCSVRWETVNFPDGQIYEGQVLVLLKRSQVEPEVEEKKSRRGLFGGVGGKDKKNKQVTFRTRDGPTRILLFFNSHNVFFFFNL